MARPHPRHAILPITRQPSGEAPGDAASPRSPSMAVFWPRSLQQCIVFVAVAGFLLFMAGFISLFGLALIAGVASFVETIFYRIFADG